MGIFDRFPYSSTHEMNLDFMLGKATEIAEDMQQVTAGMEQVQAGLSAISEKTEQATQAAAAAAQSASSIEGSVTAAEEAAEEAQTHNESAQTWANNALTYKADCQRAATEAAASSTSAAQAATAAAASEDTVAQYAQAANASAQSAANNNDSAHQYANQANASATNATFHSSNAQTAATNAQTAATNANTSATNAAASADRAATLKNDVQTLHSMCTTAVDLAAEQAVAAGNSAAQAAATKTEVENLVESLPEDFTDLNNTVNQLSDDIVDVKSDLNNTTKFVDFVPNGLHRVITNWKLGQIRSNFPNWTAATNKMTTEIPFDVKEGTKIVIASGYSAIVIRSNGNATRYNNTFIVNFSDTIWIEVNKTDDSDISTSERPISVNVDWAVNDTAYVDGTNGNDSNDGSRSYPLKTIMGAINAGFGTVYVAAGTYYEMVDLRNKYYPISIKLWSMPVYDASVSEVPKVVIDGQGTRAYGILVENNDQINLEDVHCKSCTSDPFYFKNCQYIHCVRCIATDTTGDIIGFSITNADGRFEECEAYNIGKDGFNIHGYGNTEFINCIAHDCGDDGISHHDGCTGRISGGEFYNCTKGGIASPCYGAYIDVDGVYSHDNTFGIYSVSEDTTRRITKMRISNCALKDNANVDIFFRRASGVMWNTLYDTKTIDADSTLTELT